jgi:hypothetical protein
MTRLRLAAVLAVCLLWPAGAFAQSDILDWLAEWSGPGPFTGVTFNIRTVCARDNDGRLTTNWCLNDTDPSIKTVLSVEYGWATTGRQARFYDTPGDVGVIHQQRVAAIYMYRVSPMLDAGIGGGVVWLTGDAPPPASSFDAQVHPIFIPVAVTFTPLGLLRGPTSKKAGRILRIRFSERYLFREINALDFKSASTYVRHGEFNPSFSIGLDFWSFFTR